MTGGIPILDSFRRCPYAMRARLSIASSGVRVELREILLRDKAPEFLAASPKGTVPVVVDGANVIEESFDIMQWALGQNDPENWVSAMPPQGFDLIAEFDGPFKTFLDRTKYAVRYPEHDTAQSRAGAAGYLRQIDAMLRGQNWLYGAHPTLADFAILPFVRQFANIDRAWFNAQDWPHVVAWLDRFLASDRFQSIMPKYAKWVAGDAPVYFPAVG